MDETTGKAVPRAIVTLSTASGNPMDAVAYADSQGAFAFTGLPARKYLLTATWSGYVAGTYGAKTPEAAPEILILKAGEVRRGLVIYLRAAGAIAGTVVGPDGDPVPNVQINVLKAGYSRGRPAYVSIQGSGTNSRGEYRVSGLPPGRYIVAAAPTFQRPAIIQPEGLPEQPQSGPKYVTQYYPDGDRPSAAAPVPVTAGKDTNGVDFRLEVRRAAAVRGTVDVPAECGSVAVYIAAYETGEANSNQSSGAAANPPEYKFQFPELAPGPHLLVAHAQAQGRNCRGIAHVDVGQSDDQQVSIRLEPGIELTGKVVVEGDGPGPNPARVYLAPGDKLPLYGDWPRAGLKPDGTFRLPDVLPGIWDIGVEPIPPGGFIKSMLLGDQDVLTEDMVIESGTTAPLNIVVSKRGGVVDGTVAEDEPDSKSGPVRAVVVLAPEGRFEHVLSFYRAKLADPDGHFEFRGITPGAYRLYAFDRMRGAGLQDPNYLTPYRELGVPLEIKEGDRISRNVHRITLSESGARQ